MTASNKKVKRRAAKKIVYGTIIFVAIAIFCSMAFAAYKARETISDTMHLSSEDAEAKNTPEITPIITEELTEEPSPTIRAAFIPDPDELQSLPSLDKIKIDKDELEGELDESTLNVSWEIVEDADYYVLCAMTEDEKVYHKEILWPDISEWILPQTVSGNVYLFCYEDMGEDSAEDDKLIMTLSLPVTVEEETPAETPAPTKKDQDDDNDKEDEIQNKYYIIVDKSDFTFAAFTYDENGEYTILVKAFPTAIGRSSRMTPNGTFEISSKGAWKSWSSGSYSPYYTRFTSGLYFHGAIYKEKQNNTMYKSYYNEIGTAASSGCLRTTFEAAKWVYYNCPAGTVVKIVDSSDKVSKVTKLPLDPAYPTWDPTDPDKPKLDPPAVFVNKSLQLEEGKAKSLEGSLVAADAKVEDATLVYEVISAPEHGSLSESRFTQAEIDEGSIIYTHDGSDTEKDSFKFIVTNGSSQTGTMTFNIYISSVDDTSPEIEVNEWMNIEQGESKSLEDLLLASDNEADNNELTFTVTTMPQHGSIPETFTQSALLAGDVVYAHDNSASSTDSFIFSVSDGKNTLTNQMFSISINITEPETSDEPTAEPSDEPSASPTDESSATPAPTDETTPEAAETGE